MASTYNQPTRHYLQPTGGFNLMSHLNFVSPMADDAIKFNNGSGWEPGIPAGSCMHLNTNGALETGIDDAQMPLFLLYNSWDSDAYMNYLTADGTELTSVSMNSAAGDSSIAARQNYYQYTTGGGASNAPSTWNLGQLTIKKPVQRGAYTTWPSTCGLEMSTTEFGQVSEVDGTSPVTYAPNDTLTSPVAIDPAANGGTDWANAKEPAYDPQQFRRGGYLKKGTVYTDNICGVVSRGQKMNENGVQVLYFWACYLPKKPA